MTELTEDAPGRALRASSVSEKLAGRSVVLVGMMGAGKTSIGKRLAAALNLPFIDADVEIESAAGMTISEIFARHGEAEFRAGERRVIARILGEKQVLLATGGGAWMNAATRDRIAAHGVSVWLKADVEVLLQRVRKRSNRPLLHSQDPEQTLRQLIDERYPVYARADFCVVSRDGPHGAMVDLVLDTLDRGLPVLPPRAAPGKPETAPAVAATTASAVPATARAAARHEIRVGDGMLASVGAEIARLSPGAACVVVTDANVARHCLPRLEASLAAAGIRHARVVVDPGEASKSWSVTGRVCDDILATGARRVDVVVALGGGVVLDIAGFAAATLRVRPRLVMVPTTLAAQIEGGASSEATIHSKQGRDRLAAACAPSLVLVDPRLLLTLPEREFRAGYALLVQRALASDAPLFASLESGWREIFAREARLVEAIAAARSSHAAILARDGNDEGDRPWSGPGDIFGEALERLTHFNAARLLHGEALAIGIACAFRLSARLGHCAREDAARVEAHLRAVGLPTRFREISGWNSGADAILEAMARARKAGRGAPPALARGIGDAFTPADIPAADTQAFLREELGY